MGMLNFANGFSMAGGALAQVGLEGVRASLEEDKIKLASDLAETRAVAADTRREGMQVRAEERGILNIPRTIGATADATAEATERNAGKLRQVKIDDTIAARKAELDFATDPKNVEAKAKADALAARIVATSAADTTAELMKNPDYLKNLEALTLAQHPEKRAQIAASLASAAATNFELGQKKLIAAAQKELAAATTPEAKAAAKDKIEALQWSVAADRAQQTADATVLNFLEKSIKEARAEANNPMSDDATKARATETANRAQQTYDLLREEYAKNRGLKTPEAKAKTGWDSGSKDVYKDGVKIGTAETVEAARALLAKPPAAEKKGLLDSVTAEPTVKLDPNAPDPNADVNARRRAAARQLEEQRVEEARRKRLAQQAEDAAAAERFRGLTR